MSKKLINAEIRYPELEKLALALVVASRKLRSYFHAHSIEVLTNYPLRQALQKPEALGRLLKWAIELGQFDVNACPKTSIKGQALVDFIVEFTYATTVEVVWMVDDTEALKVVEMGNKEDCAPIQEETQQWTLYVDGISNENGSRAGIILISPEGHKIHYALCLGF